ncbi:MAG: (Fe-S)-binding protein [bacterium]|nr:(Fe-S)-binding protein [bacterium]
MEFAIWERVLLAVLVLLTVTIFAINLYPRLKVVLAGKSDRVRTDHVGRRLWTTLKEVLFQTRVIGGRPVAGILHAAVFGGFIFFAFETTDHFLKPYGWHFLESILGGWVPVFKDVVAVWAVLVSVGILGLAFRRFVLVKISPDPKSWSSGVVALLIFVLMVTFLYARSEPPADPAKLNWWLHALIIVVFPHLILKSKHFHIMAGPFNVFFRTERLSELLPLDLDIEELEDEEEEPSFGLESLADLSWKQRLDFLSCVECRRCTENCPANLAGQELDPRGFILDGRAAIVGLDADSPVIGKVINEEALGQCTSCGACEAICPVGIEHLQVLTGAKRAQALALGTGMVADEFLQTLERTGNPFALPSDTRTKLVKELEIPDYELGKTDYLLWMGCVWGYNADARESLEAMVKILKASGTSFGVLKKEACCGHHSRRQGEEMQFQTLAGEVMESLQAAEVKRIVTPCPHCLHTFGREYPTLEETFQPQVIHHSELIRELLATSAIRLEPGKNGGRTTYHDPCYLGRYENVFDTPRELIRQCGLEITEIERHGKRAVCCGGGSAGFVREQEVEVRVDQVRKDHVAAVGAQLLVTACPECKMMLDSAVDETKDLAEVVAAAMV